MGLQLVLLISIDEKNQVMQTNVWLTLTWTDYQLKWIPEDYGTSQIRLPSDKVWSPDIVLFNNADGNYEVSYYSNVLVSSNGEVQWVPPAIYKSSCVIDVTFFPFDEQNCNMLFGSWTYDSNEVELDFKGSVQAMDLTDFYTSSIWDVVDCRGTKSTNRDKINYRLVLRRKTLFYTVVLIIPTVLMAFLSMMVFYLPTDAGEKMTLVISILLSLNVFLLLVSKILPPTSLIIPLMAKYLLLTFLLNVITILVTVMIVNVYYRGPTTHNMPRWIRLVFLSFFARVLLMKRPKPPGHRRRNRSSGCNGTASKKTNNNSPARSDALAAFQLPIAHPEAIQHHPYCRSSRATLRRTPAIDIELVEAEINELPPRPTLSLDAIKAIEAIEFIAQHLKDDQQYKKVRDDWKYVAMVIDRLLLYVFFGVTLGGTLGILLSANNIFDWVDQAKVLEILKVKYHMGATQPPPTDSP